VLQCKVGEGSHHDADYDAALHIPATQQYNTAAQALKHSSVAYGEQVVVMHA
jgi:hypothetical protein